MPLVVPGVGSASPSTPTAPAVVTPPVVKRDQGVAYPKQALDEGLDQTATVALVLSVDAEGAVTRADVQTGAGHGFDDAAVAAALKLEFEPAKRDGRPVAARIRFVYTFVAPPAALSGRVLTELGDKPIEGATVVVQGEDGVPHRATSDADGRWRIDGLRAGRFHVTLMANGRAPHESDETLKPAEEASVVDRLASPPAPPEAGRVSPAAREDVEDVEVRGKRPPREVTKFTMSQAELNRIPGTGGDALKSLQNLPGVARPPGFLGLLIVRGSAPADSQYFIDGTPVPIVFHFGGLSAIVPTEMIDRIDFFPGNFSSQYGRAMGAIVDVGIGGAMRERGELHGVELDPKKVHALIDVNLIDGRFVVQGPIFDTGWKFTVAGRRSYVDTWLGPVLKGLGANVSVAPVYYDYQATLEKQLSPHSSVRFGFFGTDDRLQILLTNAGDAPTLAGQIGTHTGFWRGQVLYKTKLGDQTEFRLVAAAGEDYTDFHLGSLLNFTVTDWPITGRAEVAQKLSERVTMNVGLDMGFGPYTVVGTAPQVPRVGQPPPAPISAQQLLHTNVSSTVYEPAAYLEWEATPWRGGRIVPGLRLDYTNDNSHAWDFDPRIVVRQDVTSAPRTTLKGGAGIFSQPPQPQEANVVFGKTGLSSNRAYHYDVGIEHEFSRNIDASLEGFYKQLDHLVVAGLGNTGSGVVYGAETLIRYKPDAHFFGWLSYTLSRSLRRDAPGMPLQVFQYDETHVLTVLGSYQLGRGWSFGARYRLTSGYMYTPEQYGFYDQTLGTYASLQAYPQFGSRLPLFHSLDLRVDKTWKFRWGSAGGYLDVLNVYNNANVDGYSYNYNSTQQSYANDLPILPSLGFWVQL